MANLLHILDGYFPLAQSRTWIPPALKCSSINLASGRCVYISIAFRKWQNPSVFVLNPNSINKARIAAETFPFGI